MCVYKAAKSIKIKSLFRLLFNSTYSKCLFQNHVTHKYHALNTKEKSKKNGDWRQDNKQYNECINC